VHDLPFAHILLALENRALSRVSTDEQSLDAQNEALRAAGATKICAEKVSGATAERKALKRMLKALQPGDLVLVAKLDRLARNTRDLLNITHAIAEAGAGFKVLDNPALDTTSAHGKLLFDIMGAIGEFERKLIVARTSEGRKLAKARGVKFGPKFRLSSYQRQALARREARESLVAIAKTFDVAHTTIARITA
jgi:DNA invertase Pin-like site-specific DNA recombinase